LTLPSRYLQAAIIVCFAACLLEVCLITENSASYPLYARRRTLSVSTCAWLLRRLGSTCRPSLTASTQPKGIQNP
jgi:hypothetical protein